MSGQNGGGNGNGLSGPYGAAAGAPAPSPYSIIFGRLLEARGEGRADVIRRGPALCVDVLTNKLSDPAAGFVEQSNIGGILADRFEDPRARIVMNMATFLVSLNEGPRVFGLIEMLSLGERRRVLEEGDTALNLMLRRIKPIEEILKLWPDPDKLPLIDKMLGILTARMNPDGTSHHLGQIVTLNRCKEAFRTGYDLGLHPLVTIDAYVDGIYQKDPGGRRDLDLR